MAVLNWDAVGERVYETGVDHGVLYIPDEAGAYTDGVAWNGLTTVTESPSGAEANPQYADNIKYLNLYSAEEFGATIEAYTYPEEFNQFDGMATPSPGVNVGQQSRRSFGFSYRTRVGNDLEGQDHGFKIHLVYGATASPSEKAYNTINDSPEAITFSWELTTVPVAVTGMKPTAVITIDSTKVSEADMEELTDMLYGTVGDDPMLPLPDAVLAIFSGALTLATPTIPSYNAGTGVITIPSITGVRYFNQATGVLLTAGAQAAIAVNTIVEARPATGYKFPEVIDTDWFFDAP